MKTALPRGIWAHALDKVHLIVTIRSVMTTGRSSPAGRGGRDAIAIVPDTN